MTSSESQHYSLLRSFDHRHGRRFAYGNCDVPNRKKADQIPYEPFGFCAVAVCYVFDKYWCKKSMPRSREHNFMQIKKTVHISWVLLLSLIAITWATEQVISKRFFTTYFWRSFLSIRVTIFFCLRKQVVEKVRIQSAYKRVIWERFFGQNKFSEFFPTFIRRSIVFYLDFMTLGSIQFCFISCPCTNRVGKDPLLCARCVWPCRMCNAAKRTDNHRTQREYHNTPPTMRPSLLSLFHASSSHPWMFTLCAFACRDVLQFYVSSASRLTCYSNSECQPDIRITFATCCATFSHPTSTLLDFPRKP